MTALELYKILKEIEEWQKLEGFKLKVKYKGLDFEIDTITMYQCGNEKELTAVLEPKNKEE